MQLKSRNVPTRIHLFPLGVSTHDGFDIHPIQMILHENHCGVQVLLNQLPWGPAPLVSLDNELRVNATQEVHGLEPSLKPTSFDSIHHIIDTLDRTFFYDNFDTY